MANRRIKSFLIADELNPLTIDRIADHLGSSFFIFILWKTSGRIRFKEAPNLKQRFYTSRQEKIGFNFLFLNYVSLDAENSAEIKEARLSWNVWGMETILEIGYFTIPKKSLIAVVGRVGSGKSSLLCAMLGNLHIFEIAILSFCNISFIFLTRRKFL